LSLEPGRVLGHYRLLSKLGEGGMGVVWRATDTVLDRDVAVKVLPDFFAGDPERLARFEREAKLLASFSHPHIAAIYGFHAADGVRFLAMELVEGEDLAQVLARGPLAPGDVVAVARQLADALESAHEKGIIHRDLKPANIKIDPEGRVKVLDFGLAKALEEERPAAGSGLLSQSPTITGQLTSANVLLGTAAYMSPEQTRGQAADKRADIWAFGVILFEMLTGKRLFEGDTVSDTLASVLKTDVDWRQLPAGTPSRLESLVRRCLVRDARRRLRDIGEARIVLEEIAEGKGEASGPAARTAVPPRRRSLVLGGAVAAGVILGTGAGALLLHPKTAPELPHRQFILAMPDTARNGPQVPAVSPDGKHVAFMRGGKLWIQDLDALAAHPIDVEATSGGFPPGFPFWSPDSRDVAYLVGTKIVKVSVASGQSQVVLDLGKPFTNGRGAAWCENGTIIATRAEDDGLVAVSSLGGDPRFLLQPDSTQESDFHEPSPLPGGERVLMVVHRTKGPDTIALFADGKRKNLLTVEGQRLSFPVYSSTGHILFQRMPTNAGIWAVPFSLSEQKVTGEPFLVVPNGQRPTLAGDGTLVYLRGSMSTNTQFVWMDDTGRELGGVGAAETGYEAMPKLSPDGTRLLIAQFEDQDANLFVVDPVRGSKTRLTFENGVAIGPTWWPDGRRVAYQWAPRGPIAKVADYSILSRSADGSDVPDTLARGAVLPSFSPDQRYLIYSVDPTRKWDFDLTVLPLGGGKAYPIAGGTGDQLGGAVSPRGDLIAYVSNESGELEVYLKRFPGGEGRWQVSTGGGAWPRWNTKGDRLYYVQRFDIMEVEVTPGVAPVLGPPKRLFSREPLGTGAGFRNLPPGYDVSPNGRFLLLKPVGVSAEVSAVAAVQNWYEGFREKKKE
jgi:eukaryotic-like serine/threonine-protein kinase